jgi:CMP-N-acetylneuraminic acid synthetase
VFQKEKVLAIVPARSGSKGIKDKNITNLQGKPLLSWTSESARKCEILDDVAISSDSKKIIALAKKAGATKFIHRPKSLSTDSASSVDVIIHALDLYPSYKWYVLLQPTSPLRNEFHIHESFNLLNNHSSQSVVSISESKSKPNHIFSIDNKTQDINPILGWPGLLMPRQSLKKYYELNGAIYIGRADDIRRTKKLMDIKTLGYIMDQAVSLDIDDPEDLKVAQTILENRGL